MKKTNCLCAQCSAWRLSLGWAWMVKALCGRRKGGGTEKARSIKRERKKESCARQFRKTTRQTRKRQAMAQKTGEHRRNVAYKTWLSDINKFEAVRLDLEKLASTLNDLIDLRLWRRARPESSCRKCRKKIRRNVEQATPDSVPKIEMKFLRICSMEMTASCAYLVARHILLGQ